MARALARVSAALVARAARAVAAALLAVALAAAPGRAAPAPAGAWQGTLMGLRLVLHVSADSAGALRGTLDSPDQGATGLAIDTLWVAGDSLRLDLRRLGAAYAARFAGDDSLAGAWSQGGRTFALGLARAAHPVEMRRPQEPRPPYPYDTLDVGIPNRAAPGVTLAATLTLPRTPGLHPAVVLVTGSGPQDRDETLFGHRPFLVIADDLTRRGFAVLRADDRGTGRSTGEFKGATTEDFVGDTRALFDWLVARPGIDPRHVGIIGHSEGGLIAPIVAARDPRVAFIVLLAGPGVRGDSLMLRQGDDMRRAMGLSDSSIALQHRAAERVLEILRTEPDLPTAMADARMVTREALAALPERASLGDLDRAADEQVRRLATPWFRWFLAHDPAPVLRLVRCPVLALNGEKDTQVAWAPNLAAIERALRAGGNRDVTARMLPGLNHLFQTAATGSPAEYGRIEETFAPAALAAMEDWLVAHARPGRAEPPRRAPRRAAPGAK